VVTLKAALKKKLPDSGRIALLGVGSELRGDDAAGLLVAECLRKSPPKKIKQKKLKVFFGSTAPENLTGEIKKFKPACLVIVDSADMNRRPGTVKLINPDQISGISFCTHQLPLKIMTDYLAKSIGCEILIIGIQPGKIDFGAPLSREVEKSAKDISDTIKEILSKEFFIQR